MAYEAEIILMLSGTVMVAGMSATYHANAGTDNAFNWIMFFVLFGLNAVATSVFSVLSN